MRTSYVIVLCLLALAIVFFAGWYAGSRSVARTWLNMQAAQVAEEAKLHAALGRLLRKDEYAKAQGILDADAKCAKERIDFIARAAHLEDDSAINVAINEVESYRQEFALGECR